MKHRIRLPPMGPPPGAAAPTLSITRPGQDGTALLNIRRSPPMMLSGLSSLMVEPAAAWGRGSGPRQATIDPART
ncbi:hypothetical protein AMIS_26690 [Actinoplanes missouriensis 431]|uniref:Uncharacterized protein n=1 Tax=Actinoplanes missouriensis (strain ATCC 14538 / DSM 43046 / CBS 188.64 / JCM 3121 / NBRC 102363 / NCIMB 12654 / NRRL B-3342 / UNCC 431) TaxID=512565 RepID=I0H4F2_ACTM4|nr:hypothetical protein AMIS_26690 [Actinoplanes missouriensis 431]